MYETWLSAIIQTVRRAVRGCSPHLILNKGNMMNTVRKHVLVALAALSLGGAALAQQTEPQPAQDQRAHPTQEQRQAKMAEFRARHAQQMAQRQQELHDALKLSGAQEQAWSTFVASMKPAEPRQQHDHAAFATLPAPERMRKMIELSKQHTAQMESRLAALNTFYSTLSPEQKKVFDEQTRHFMGGHGGHHGGHGSGMMHH
jgi:periplasmic protein CpxP/Spy